ncbi:MAG: glycosyltransferase [Phycisphaeraceae bacterium]|nr:glycosyltransferase [Phycisphaeraceae bacterium]
MARKKTGSSIPRRHRERTPKKSASESLPPAAPGLPPLPPVPAVEPPPAPADDAQSSGRRLAEPLLLEVSWEVCNQLGGIYTVLRSKVPSMVARWGSRYCLIGPYNHHAAQVEFEAAPLVGPIGQAVQQMRDMGFYAHYGRWLVSGRPHVVLLEGWHAQRVLHEVKYRLYADHSIPTPADDSLVNDVVMFGECVRMFLSMLGQTEARRRKLVAHFHEWMAGAAVPMLRKENWPGSIVFTTHATLLGRYLATHNPLFYDHLPFFNADAEAHHYNVEAQHRIERSAAHGSHVFTTVSDITAEECKHLLGRHPDVLLPNGLNIERFTATHQFQNLHNEYKAKIHQFTIGHFFPSYNFDLEQTLYMFTSGRYEYRNKGLDLTIESLARLNHRLKEAGAAVNVVFFIITRAPYRSINVAALQSNAMLNELREAADTIKSKIGDRLFYEAAAGHIPDLNTLVDDYWRLRLRRTMLAWRRESLPPIVTHDLQDDANDAILRQLRACALFNGRDDPVKIIYHPDFITLTNPLFSMDYDQFVRGCHLGVFPSYYEPWGYTPLEAVALGVPAITSDLSGFGSYLTSLVANHDERGVYVIRRRGRDFNDAANQLTDRLFRYCQLSRRERIALRNSAESFSEHFDWHNLGKRYHEAHELALDRLS